MEFGIGKFILNECKVCYSCCCARTSVGGAGSGSEDSDCSTFEDAKVFVV